MISKRVLLLLLAFGLCLSAGSVMAQENPFESLSPEEIQDLVTLIQQAEGAWEAEDWELALNRYRAAQRILALDDYAFSEAEALVRLERAAEAIPIFQRLANSDDSDISSASQRRIDELGPTIPMTLQVSSVPAGALVRVDGTVVGETSDSGPVEIEVLPGQHDVTLTAGGYEAWNEQFEVAPLVDPEPIVARLLTPPSIEPSDQASEGDPIAWTLIGVGGAAIVTSTVLLVAAIGDWNEVSDMDDNTQAFTRAERDALADDGNRLGTISAIAGGVGAGLVVTGILMMVLDSDSPDSPTAFVVPHVSEHQLGAGLSFTF
ncbi:MAG: PEGA domain-containing protein [Myxococcales bacterium]|nr:PEGA domain-containing protein [Myxococcales bacterium]